MNIEESNNINKKLSKTTLKRLLKYALPYWYYFVIAVAIIFVIVYLELAQPVIIGQATDLIVDNNSMDKSIVANKVIGLAFKYVLVVFVGLFLTYIQGMVLAFIGQKIIYKIRLDVFEQLQRLSISFYNANPIGRLVTRATNDIDTLNEMYTSVIVNIIKSVFMLVGIIITMLSFNVRLSLYTFSIIPFIILFTYIYSKVSKKVFRQIRVKIAALNAFISEHISGMKIVQIFAVEDKKLNEFKEKSDELKKTHMKQIIMHAIYGPSSYFLNIVALIILLWIGSKMYIEGAITIGTIVIFQRYIGKFFEPIEEFAEQLAIIQSASASAERIFGLLDEKVSVVDKEDAIELSDVKGKIEFKNVWFSYEPDEWILRDVSFVVEPGQRVAFVGATGAGKTTIQNLIGRYFDIQKGQILIDDIDIRDIKIDSIRKNIGQMLQDVFLFTGDIKSNIRLKNKDINDEEIISAAKYVNADSFISKLDNKYDEIVNENGTSLSSGQRQLISFARTLAFKPQILILDEATANIDTETESLIQDALEKLMNGRTSLVVAHRLSTIQNADKIIVMQKGKVVEEGSHQNLLSAHGLYYKLYKLQYEHA